jgi:hypothetical protein
MNPLINILLRTSYRPQLFTRCLQSIEEQTYKHTHVIVGYDNDQALDYIPRGMDKIPVSAGKGYPYFYDLYCNQLKKYVNDGWFMFLDDDDVLDRPTALDEIAAHLTEPGAVICQFLRKATPKPSVHRIQRCEILEGKIGLPCLFLHSKYKDVSGLDGYEAGDYRYILSVSAMVPTKFVPVVVVRTDRRSLGKCEKKLPNSFNSY